LADRADPCRKRERPGPSGGNGREVGVAPRNQPSDLGCTGWLVVCTPPTQGVAVATNVPRDAHLGAGIVPGWWDLEATRWPEVSPKLAGHSLPWEEGWQIIGAGGPFTTRLGRGRRGPTRQWHGWWGATGSRRCRAKQSQSRCRGGKGGERAEHVGCGHMGMPAVLEVKLAEEFLEIRCIRGHVGARLGLELDVQAELHPAHHIDWCEWVLPHLLFKLCRLGLPSGSKAIELIGEAMDGPKEGVEQDPVAVQGNAYLEAGGWQTDLVR
jgi:hypothetical protein